MRVLMFCCRHIPGRISQVPVLVNPLLSVRQRYENQTPRNGSEAGAGLRLFGGSIRARMPRSSDDSNDFPSPAPANIRMANEL